MNEYPKCKECAYCDNTNNSEYRYCEFRGYKIIVSNRACSFYRKEAIEAIKAKRSEKYDFVEY